MGGGGHFNRSENIFSSHAHTVLILRRELLPEAALRRAGRKNTSQEVRTKRRPLYLFFSIGVIKRQPTHSVEVRDAESHSARHSHSEMLLPGGKFRVATSVCRGSV